MATKRPKPEPLAPEKELRVIVIARPLNSWNMRVFPIINVPQGMSEKAAKKACEQRALKYLNHYRADVLETHSAVQFEDL